jgi:spoIIIJ-associated protein
MDKIQTTKDITEQLLKLVLLEAKVEVTEDKENNAINVAIETEEPGILIGYHGETLSSLQLMLGIMVSKKINEWVRVVVNVGDYREKREEVLKRMALSAAQKAKFSQEAVTLPPLSGNERRIIHLVLTDNPDVTTESEGEGDERRVVVKPKTQ